jgi:glutamate-1-semialdehyde aminotransferase
MANGLPLSAIVGPWEYMKRYEEDVFFSLTHGGEALSLAAADETLRIVAEQDVPEQIAELGLEIIALFETHGRSNRIKYGYPQRLVFDFTRDELGILLENGVLCAGYANLTLAHVEDEKARQTILDAFGAVLSA